MSYRVQAAPTAHLPWLARKTGCSLTTDFNALEAVDGGGRIRGMVGYANWTRNSVQMHMAVEAPSVWRALLRPALEYPFVQVGVDICLGTIPAGNARSVRFTSSVGFKEVHRVRDGWDVGEDLVVMELRRANCRYLLWGDRARETRAA